MLPRAQETRSRQKAEKPWEGRCPEPLEDVPLPTPCLLCFWSSEPRGYISLVETCGVRPFVRAHLPRRPCPPAAPHQVNPHGPPKGPHPLCQAGCCLHAVETSGTFSLPPGTLPGLGLPTIHLPFANALKAPSTTRTILPPLQRRSPQDPPRLLPPPLLGEPPQYSTATAPRRACPCCLRLGLEQRSPFPSPDQLRSLFQDAAEAWRPRSLPTCPNPSICTPSAPPHAFLQSRTTSKTEAP